ncbi:amino-acid N-acetyltransferase [Nitratiruptor sp. YY08-14]|nr:MULTISPECIES: N-acetyltransferase [unclassified Nitratiruptor]BCD60497.1 amino-acid N-acetyltransferase [Nitratiruptor sp. YY08-10]BCD64014.1 amino-acid N-acetyltransferase [Nitratiruptor sp. YY08-14]
MEKIHYCKPTLLDIDDMQKLVEPYVKEGIILPRSDDEIATNIRSYTVAKTDKNIIGYVALHIHSKTLAEIRSLVVSRVYQGKGIGKALVEKAIKEGKFLKVKKILSLTYNKEFFQKIGFYEINKEDVPEHKIWQDCIKCKHFPICNEVAMMIDLG